MYIRNSRLHICFIGRFGPQFKWNIYVVAYVMNLLLISEIQKHLYISKNSQLYFESKTY